MWTRLSPYLPPAVIALLTFFAGQELLTLRFAADSPAPAPDHPLLATTFVGLGLPGVLLWGLYRLTRRESRVFVELFWSWLGLSVVVGVASVGITGTWPGPGRLLAWVGGVFLLWCLSLTQTEPGPDPVHLWTGPGAGF